MSLTLHTSLGDMKVEVFCDKVPKTAENFLALAAAGYYDGTSFHRLIKGFMVQGGDPTGTGKGGESIYGKYFEDEFVDPPLRFVARGTLGMANRGPDTNNSQFFITFGPQPHLDQRNTVGLQMLPGQQFRGGHQRNLPAACGDSQGQGEGDRRLAAPDLPMQQPTQGLPRGQIPA